MSSVMGKNIMCYYIIIIAYNGSNIIMYLLSLEIQSHQRTSMH